MNGWENRQEGSWHFQQELWRERKWQFPDIPKQPKEILSVVEVWKEEKCISQNTATPLREGREKTLPLFPVSWLKTQPKWCQVLSTRFFWYVLFRWGGGLVLCCFLLQLRLTKITNLFSCWILPALLAAFPGRFTFCGKQRVGGGRREQQPSPTAPSRIPGKAQAPRRVRPCSGRSLCTFPGKENAIPGSFGLAFTFKSASRGTGLGAHPKTRAKV